MDGSPREHRTLDEILAGIWRDLVAGMRDGHPFHLPVLGSVCSPPGATANAPHSDQRIVVLRVADEASRRLFANTDRRSAKIAQLSVNSNVSWLFYHPEKKQQVRVRGRAHVHLDDEVADESWAAATLGAKRCYCGDAPGRPSADETTGLPQDLESREPTVAESEAGRSNFAVIRSTIESFDWLELGFRGHRRAKFTWGDAGMRQATWLTP